MSEAKLTEGAVTNVDLTKYSYQLGQWWFRTSTKTQGDVDIKKLKIGDKVKVSYKSQNKDGVWVNWIQEHYLIQTRETPPSMPQEPDGFMDDAKPKEPYTRDQYEQEAKQPIITALACLNSALEFHRLSRPTEEWVINEGQIVATAQIFEQWAWEAPLRKNKHDTDIPY